jgi:hypothetical protein
MSEDSQTIRLPDPNLQLFDNDVERRKAYRWFTIKSIFLKTVSIICGTVTGAGSLFKWIESLA